MKTAKWMLASVALLAMSKVGHAQGTLAGFNGDCQVGGQQVITQGLASSGTQQINTQNVLQGAGVQASFPSCFVTVYGTGTLTKASLFSNNPTVTPTPLGNPFTANVDGSYTFFIVPGACFDIVLSTGTGPNMPYSRTLTDVCIGTGGGGGGSPGGSVNSVQFNNFGAFGGSANFTFDPVANALTLNAAFNQTGSLGLAGNFTQTGNLTETGNAAISGTLSVGGNLTTNMTGGPFCVHETAGVLSATASDCGAGGGGVTGTGTLNFIPRWTSSTAIGNSTLQYFPASGGIPAVYVTLDTWEIGGTYSSSASFGFPEVSIQLDPVLTGTAVGNPQGLNIFMQDNTTVTTATMQSMQGLQVQVIAPNNITNAVSQIIGINATVSSPRFANANSVVTATFARSTNGSGATPPTTSNGITLNLSETGAVGGGTTTNDYAILINAPVNNGSIWTHHYGIYIGDQTVAGSGSNADPWGIFEAGTAKNQFGGSLTLANLASAGTQCLHVSAAGLISGTGTDCGSSSAGFPPGTGIPQVVAGSAWGSTLGTSGSGNVALTNSPVFVTPNLGTPSTLVLTNATGAPTWNQTTTGTAASLTGCTVSTAGSMCIWTGSAWLVFAGNTSGTASLQENASGVPSWGSGSATTFQTNGVSLNSATTVNFQNSAATDGLTLTFSNPSAGNVQLGFTGTLTNAGLTNSSLTLNGATVSLGASGNISFQTNGTPNTSLTNLNAINSTVNAVGLTVTFSNPATNQWKAEITGGSYTGNAAGLFGTPSITVNSLTATTINGTTWAGTWVGSPTISGNPAFTGSPVFNMIGGPFCVQETAGVLSSTGTACGSGGGIGTGTQNFVTYWATSSTLGSVGSNVSGQILASQNGGPPVFSSPSLLDSGSAPITGTPYTIQCDSATTILDRSTTLPFTSGASAVTVPLSSGSGCAGLAVIIEAQTALTLTPTGGDTFTVYGAGGAALTGQTTFSIASGQTVSMNQSSTGVWTLRMAAGGSVYSVATGAGLTGGTITGTGTVSIANLGVTNAMIANATIAVGKFAAQTQNTVLGSFTGTAVQALALASCNGNNQAETYVTNTGFACGSNFGQLNVASTWTANQTLTGHLIITSHDITIPLACADTSASGTAQVCNTSPTFTPASGDRVAYTTTTANTGAGLTVNVNSLGAKSVAKYQTNTTLAANDVKANTQVLLTYDGTNWELDTIGNTPAGTGTVTVVGAGSLTSTALVTGGGTTTLQTPSATSTLSAAGNMSLAGTFAAAGLGTFSSAGAASTPGLTVTGAAYTAGTATTNFPQFYVNAGTGPTTLSSNGTQIGINSASGFTGNLIDGHINGGASVWSVNYQGNETLAGTLSVTGHVTLEAVTSTGATGTGNLAFSASPTFTGTLTAATIAATTFSGAVNFSGTPTFANAVALGSSTATTQSNCDNSTKLATTAYTNTECTNIESSGSPLTLTGLTGYYYNDTASAYTFQLDAPVAGKQYCFGNRKARASAITIKSLASVTIYYKGVAGTTGTGGSLVSGGAAGDFVCMVGTDTTTYEVTGAGFGTWTNN